MPGSQGGCFQFPNTHTSSNPPYTLLKSQSNSGTQRPSWASHMIDGLDSSKATGAAADVRGTRPTSPAQACLEGVYVAPLQDPI